MKRTYSLAELATVVGGTVRGDPTVTVSGIGEVDTAAADQLTWADGAKYVSRLHATRAAAVLLAREAAPTSIPAILCDQPDRALAQVMELMAPPAVTPERGIHPTAVVDPTASLGLDVAVGPLVVIGSGVTIGDQTQLHPGVHLGSDCRIGSHCVLWDHVTIRERCVVGDHVRLDAQVVIGSDGFGYTFVDGGHRRYVHAGNVEIHDHVDIGAGCTIDRAKLGSTVIGRGTKLDNLVHVAHNVQIGSHCMVLAGVVFGGSVILEDGVIIAGNAGVRDHVTLGRGARVAGMSCVWNTLAADVLVSGIPARDHKDQMRMLAAAQRGPALLAQVKELSERVKQLEAAADHLESR